jgi:hypothetical protein
MIKFRSGFGTDRYYHRLIVDLIVKNRHKLITVHSNLLNTNIMSYPQLLHWVMSFLPERGYVFWSKYLNVLITTLLSVLNFGFVTALYPKMESIVHMPYGYYILWCSLIFALIPYSYFGNNAKNVGLSARGVGLLFTHAFVYFTILLVLDFNWVYYGVVVLLGFFIILSSQFATQYLLLSFIPIGILFQQWELFAVPFVAWILIFIIARKVAVNMVLGQGRHKVLYATRLAKVFILQFRESIWLDVFNLLPRKIYRVLFGHTKLKDEYPYFQGNALVIFFLQMPFVVLILLKMFIWPEPGLALNVSFSIIVITVGIFFLTTFRITRFLGEPERYMEFVFGLFGVAVLALYHDYIWIIVSVLAFSVILVAAQLYQAYQRRLVDSTFAGEAIEYRKLLEEMSDKGTDLRLLANSTELVKIFLSTKIPQYWFVVNGLQSDGITFQELYRERYEAIEPTQLPRLIEKYDITHLAIEKKYIENHEARLVELGIKFRMSKESANISLYEIAKPVENSKP